MSRFRLRSPGKLQLSENDVERACLDLLRTHHWWPIRQHVGLFRTASDSKHWISMGEAGDPDYAVMRAPGFFLEVKRPGGKLSEAQKQRIYQLELFYDLKTVVVDDVEQLMKWLETYEGSR